MHNLCYILMILLAGVSGIMTIQFPINSQDQTHYKDCHQLQEAGYSKSGVYYLWKNSSEPYKSFCNLNEDAAADYRLILQRAFGNETFNRGWHDYTYGFGNGYGDYWAGLRNIYNLTSTGFNVLIIHMQDWNGNTVNARYNHFKLLDSKYYTLSVGGFSGQVTDDLSYSHGSRFSTTDNDATNCARLQLAGWWYKEPYCAYALPTGHYYHGGTYCPVTMMYNGVYWSHWKGYTYSLKYISMMLSTN